MVEGIKHTLSWYVHDNKLSPKTPAVISDIINKVKNIFGYLSVVRGNNNIFLGVNIEIKDNIIQVDMVKQLEECITIFGEDFSTTFKSPATKKLFEVRKDSEKLLENKGDLFHSVLAKLLLMIKKSRPDLETSVSSLMTIVSNINVDDWGKMKRILRFVNCTLKSKRVFGATNLDEIFT